MKPIIPVALASFFCCSLWAQEIRLDTYGTSALTVHPVNSSEFIPYNSSTIYDNDGENGRYVTSGNTCFDAPVVLPAGAIIDHIDLEACDFDAAQNVSASLIGCAASCGLFFTVITSGNPGCTRFSSATGAVQVNNNTIMYTARICTNDFGILLRFRSIRVYYRLQVSPAPLAATFPNDVPTTHPFFQYIEALAAAGVTAGCGAGSYCPDALITRGQMAVFLARALGLHWAP